MYVYDTEGISGIVKRPRKTRPRPRIWGRGMVPYVEGQTSLSIATRQTKSREAEGKTERESEGGTETGSRGQNGKGSRRWNGEGEADGGTETGSRGQNGDRKPKVERRREAEGGTEREAESCKLRIEVACKREIWRCRECGLKS